MRLERLLRMILLTFADALGLVLAMALALLLSSCSYGLRTHDCAEPVDGDCAVLEIARVFPNAETAASRMDVTCRPREEVEYEADAVTWWVGSPVARGRMDVADGVPVLAAIAHEANHWEHFEDPCYQHDCAFWSWAKIERLSHRLEKCGKEDGVPP